jgi:NTP pyrophosphatase (non-canonical NTP hydrolase)
MNTHEYMEQALATESLPKTELTHEQKRLTHAGLGLCTEAAELADAVKKHIFYGKPLDKVNLVEEIGDILWYSAIVLDACQSSLEDAMDRNIGKLRKRYPQGIFSASKAIHRDVEAERVVLESNCQWILPNGCFVKEEEAK